LTARRRAHAHAALIAHWRWRRAWPNVRVMVDLAEKRLTVHEFLVWAEGREGKWELVDGSLRALSPERVRHTQTKTEAAFALREAVRRAVAPCRAFVDGITLRIRDDRAFVPDAVVVCPPPPDAVEIDNPLIVVEVLSPPTAALDHGVKLESYFSLASVAHYLILDPDRRVVIHHARGGDVIETRILRSGALRLTPPGLELDIADLFGPPEM
jgi:Uma2 family endonuclease